MQEPKSTTDTMTSASVAAVMPCVGGFIYWVAQNGIEGPAERERQKIDEMPADESARDYMRECVD